MRSPLSPLRFCLGFSALLGAVVLLTGCPNFTIHVDTDGSASAGSSSSSSSSDGVTTTTSSVSVHSGWGDSTSGSGTITTDTRTPGDFSRINADGATSVEVTTGSPTSVAVTIDDNLQSFIETKVADGTLHITSTKSYRNTNGVKVKITTPTLDGVNLSGACDLHATGLDAQTFDLDLSGSSKIYLAGKADTLKVQISGAGKFDSADLTAAHVTLDISGAGSAHVNATQSLDASISGAGSVRYTGHPADVHKSVSGAGSIKSE